MKKDKGGYKKDERGYNVILEFKDKEEFELWLLRVKLHKVLPLDIGVYKARPKELGLFQFPNADKVCWLTLRKMQKRRKTITL